MKRQDSLKSHLFDFSSQHNTRIVPQLKKPQPQTEPGSNFYSHRPSDFLRSVHYSQQSSSAATVEKSKQIAPSRQPPPSAKLTLSKKQKNMNLLESQFGKIHSVQTLSHQHTVRESPSSKAALTNRPPSSQILKPSASGNRSHLATSPSVGRKTPVPRRDCSEKSDDFNTLTMKQQINAMLRSKKRGSPSAIVKQMIRQSNLSKEEEKSSAYSGKQRKTATKAPYFLRPSSGLCKKQRKRSKSNHTNKAGGGTSIRKSSSPQKFSMVSKFKPGPAVSGVPAVQSQQQMPMVIQSSSASRSTATQSVMKSRLQNNSVNAKSAKLPKSPLKKKSLLEEAIANTDLLVQELSLQAAEDERSFRQRSIQQARNLSNSRNHSRQGSKAPSKKSLSTSKSTYLRKSGGRSKTRQKLLKEASSQSPIQAGSKKVPGAILRKSDIVDLQLSRNEPEAEGIAKRSPENPDKEGEENLTEEVQYLLGATGGTNPLSPHDQHDPHDPHEHSVENSQMFDEPARFSLKLSETEQSEAALCSENVSRIISQSPNKPSFENQAVPNQVSKLKPQPIAEPSPSVYKTKEENPPAITVYPKKVPAPSTLSSQFFGSSKLSIAKTKPKFKKAETKGRDDSIEMLSSPQPDRKMDPITIRDQLNEKEQQKEEVQEIEESIFPSLRALANARPRLLEEAKAGGLAEAFVVDSKEETVRESEINIRDETTLVEDTVNEDTTILESNLPEETKDVGADLKSIAQISLAPAHPPKPLEPSPGGLRNSPLLPAGLTTTEVFTTFTNLTQTDKEESQLLKGSSTEKWSNQFTKPQQIPQQLEIFNFFKKNAPEKSKGPLGLAAAAGSRNPEGEDSIEDTTLDIEQVNTLESNNIASSTEEAIQDLKRQALTVVTKQSIDTIEDFKFQSQGEPGSALSPDNFWTAKSPASTEGQSLSQVKKFESVEDEVREKFFYSGLVTRDASGLQYSSSILPGSIRELKQPVWQQIVAHEMGQLSRIQTFSQGQVPSSKPSEKMLKPSLKLYAERRVLDKARVLEAALEQVLEDEMIDSVLDKIPENIKAPVVKPLHSGATEQSHAQAKVQEVFHPKSRIAGTQSLLRSRPDSALSRSTTSVFSTMDRGRRSNSRLSTRRPSGVARVDRRNFSRQSPKTTLITDIEGIRKAGSSMDLLGKHLADMQSKQKL